MLNSPTGPASWTKVSPIEVLVSRACDPSLHEPNYALHLEVADFINTKKANNPRESAMLIARLANHRNPHIAILALSLLDTLVQSCGYPFHLQISTKEFLNELVRRFPERPPPFPGPVMSRILDLIQGWKEGICVESRWREDLGNIRDMHRLLTFKGYRFRSDGRPQPSLAVASNLKSAEELEAEDREAQSAKLQELIRRGTPRDLAAAQELMKALAGANPDARPDYRSEALTELNKLEQKVVLLNEMLDNADTSRGERFVSGDVYEQVSSILSNARPKIQKWISDAETDDPESLDTFLQINDQINTVLNRYEAFKRGDYVTASNPIPAELSRNNDAGGASLIDLDDTPSTSSGGGTGLTGDDLAGLFSAAPAPAPTPVPIPSYNSGNVSSTTRPLVSPNPTPMAGLGIPNFSNTSNYAQQPRTEPASMYASSGFAYAYGTPESGIMLPRTPVGGQSPHNFGGRASAGGNQSPPNYFSGGGGPTGPVGTGNGGMGMGTGTQRHQQQTPIQQQSPAPTSPSTTTTTAGKDPFADLVGLF